MHEPDSVGAPKSCNAFAAVSPASLAALSYFQQVNGERSRGAVERPKFDNSLIS